MKNPFKNIKNLPILGRGREFKDVEQAYSYRPRTWIYNLVFFLIIFGIFVYCVIVSNLFNGNNWADVNTFKSMIKGFFVPNFEYMFGYGKYTFKTSVVYELLQTFAIAFAGTLISSILSIPFGFFASRKMVGKWAIISELILILIRTFPEILFGFIMIKGTGFGAFTAMLVISIHSIGMIGKLYSEQLDLVDNGPIEALNACGASTFSRINLAVVPQVAPNFLNVILYRLDLNVRTAALLGLCAGDDGGIGYFINSFATNYHWPELGSIMWGIILMVLAVDFVSSQIRKKIV